MRRLTAMASGLALAACGSSGGSGADLCTRAVAVSESFANALDGCFGDAGVNGAQQAAETSACQTSLTSCTAADQKILTAEIGCIAGLPPVECKWIQENEQGVDDGGYSDWVATVTACEATAQLSAGCPGLGYLAPQPCGGGLCPPPLACVTGPDCGPHCGCLSDSNCAPDERCGPSVDCGLVCYPANL